MPIRPVGRCTYPGCGNKATWRGRCDEHQDTWSRASKHTTLINQAKWDQVRHQALRRDHDTCVMCGKPGNEVDHIREIADNGSLYDLDNLQTLCHHCHLHKTIMMARRRRERRRRKPDSTGFDAMSMWDRLGLER